MGSFQTRTREVVNLNQTKLNKQTHTWLTVVLLFLVRSTDDMELPLC